LEGWLAWDNGDGGIMGIVSLSFILSLLLSFVLDKWGLLFWERRSALFLLEQGNWMGMGWDGMVGSARLAICTGERS